jgi:hypothetical protein
MRYVEKAPETAPGQAMSRMIGAWRSSAGTASVLSKIAKKANSGSLLRAGYDNIAV